ncbi:MAG: NAD(P)-dependent oxidoreductase [Rhodomicrobium sp.]
MPGTLPVSFSTLEELDAFMSNPSQALIDDLDQVPGDIMVIGAGGKMGPTLARMAKRACPSRRVIAVARFTEPGLKAFLNANDIETIAADLLDPMAIKALPTIPNVIFMAGRKFGSSGNEPLTWAMNSFVPGLIADHFRRSRIVVFSTICVYPFAPVMHGGSREEDAVAPPGEYAMSCVGRERMFQYFSQQHNTPGILIRLSYSIDMQYGVLHDLGNKILRDEVIDLAMGHVNVIWQGDACSQALRALRHCNVPSFPLNVSGPETVSIRSLALAFAEKLGRTPKFTGEESPAAWLANTSRAARLFGYPAISLNQMVDWTADWLSRGMASLGKETHFEVRSGIY